MTSIPDPSPTWSRPLKLVHLLLATAVTIQLFLGSFMRSPHPAQADSAGFLAHEILGAIILVLVLAHWAWSSTHPAEGLRRLFPWTRRGLRNVYADVRHGIRERRLPAGGPGTDAGGLASFVHGLGLLAVTAMVVIGSAFFLARLDGATWSNLNLIEDIHDTVAVIVWIYWGGHLAATLAHSVLHQPVWRRMVDFGK